MTRLSRARMRGATRMSVYLTRQHLSRRAVLRGAGAAIALPLLESMMPARHAPRAARRARGSRASTFRTAPSCGSWTPAARAATSSFSRSCSSLEPFRDRLNSSAISTCRWPTARTPRPARTTRAPRPCWLTCARPETGATPRLGITVDQVAARHFGQDTPLPSLELVARGRRLKLRLGPLLRVPQYDRLAHPTSPLPMEDNPQVVFERLFGDGSTAEERARRRAQAASLLDSVLDDARALSSASARRRPRAPGALSRRRARGRAPHRARGDRRSATTSTCLPSPPAFRTTSRSTRG